MNMSMDNIVGRVIGLILNNCRGLAMTGHDQKVHKENFFARVAGFDVFGIWVESRYKGVLTHVYFPWGNIKSLIFFPEKDEVALDDDEKCLGFACSADAQRHMSEKRPGYRPKRHRKQAKRAKRSRR